MTEPLPTRERSPWDRPCGNKNHPHDTRRLLSGGCLLCWEVYSASLDAKGGMLALTCAKRGRTKGNIYNYDYWQCPRCQYFPGGENGPPSERCGNCGKNLYVQDMGEATFLIEFVRTHVGFDHRIVWSNKTEAKP